jgi:hypothetical protein
MVIFKLLPGTVPGDPKHKVIRVRVPKDAGRGPAQTFYVGSESKPNVEYVVRSRPRSLFSSYSTPPTEFLCSCEDFVFTKWAQHRPCKHIDEIDAFAQQLGGIEKLAEFIRLNDSKS